MTRNNDEISPNPTTHICQTASNLEVYFYDYGGSGPTILFAHAAGFHGHIWDQTIFHLRNQYRCVTFDFRGHGRSSGSATNPSPLDQAWPSLFTDIPDVANQLNVEGPLFGVGHSLGGAGLVSAQISNPELFDALWLYEPIVFEPNPIFGVVCEKMASAAEGRKASFVSTQDAIDNFSPRPPFDTVNPEVLADYVEHGFVPKEGEIRLRCKPETEAATYRNGADLDIFNETDGITINVCVAAGSIDPQATRLGQRLSTHVLSGTFVTLESLGHLGPLENPSQTAMSISNFLGSY